MMSLEETRRWMLIYSDRETHLCCSIEQKRESWFERWRLFGRVQESGDDRERWGSELVGLTSLVR